LLLFRGGGGRTTAEYKISLYAHFAHSECRRFVLSQLKTRTINVHKIYTQGKYIIIIWPNRKSRTLKINDIPSSTDSLMAVSANIIMYNIIIIIFCSGYYIMLAIFFS